MKGADELYNFKKNLQQMQHNAASIYEAGRAALRASTRPNSLVIPTVDASEVCGNTLATPHPPTTSSTHAPTTRSPTNPTHAPTTRSPTSPCANHPTRVWGEMCLQPFVASGKSAPPVPRSVTGRMLRALAARDVARTDLKTLEQQAAELGPDPVPLPTASPLKYASGDSAEED